jgi:hypothetical protein
MMQNNPNANLLSEIDDFLAETGMGASYFGRLAVRNTELVDRLRRGGRIWPDTETALRAFMADSREKRRTG